MEPLQGISQVMEVSEKSSADDLNRAGAVLADAKNRAREAIQELTAEEMEAIIKKLGKGQPLTPEEKDYVRSWIIGDAEGYTRVENHLQAWLQEFKALQSAIKDYEDKEMSVQDLLNLHAVLEDAVRVAANIEEFLEKKERIERFERSMQNIDQEDAPFIVSILRGQLQSEDV
jgi:cell fate (sporulation/competence/biofilm development) regulator YlbF (YheA/YmcA/DUF963 family)